MKKTTSNNNISTIDTVNGTDVEIFRNKDGYYEFDPMGIIGCLDMSRHTFASIEDAETYLANFREHELEDARMFGEALKAGEPDGYRVRWTIPGSGNIDSDEFDTLAQAHECFDTMCRDSGRDAKIVDLLTVYGGEDGDVIITNRNEFGGVADDEPTMTVDEIMDETRREVAEQMQPKQLDNGWTYIPADGIWKKPGTGWFAVSGPEEFEWHIVDELYPGGMVVPVRFEKSTDACAYCDEMANRFRNGWKPVNW